MAFFHFQVMVTLGVFLRSGQLAMRNGTRLNTKPHVNQKSRVESLVSHGVVPKWLRGGT